ncbi:MAG: hypothetical protein CTY31_12040 [Hyphomicrobium sp.]|nr:MAG: hypothetical protein CTY39_12160 [Hyphomicrobium sp.]PPC98755.1 MAG: hypothetical protein CTY31_12040 [Hyphomicrobium sp.]
MTDEPNYRKLKPNHIIKTLITLEQRITQRLPGSGLSRVCAELKDIAAETQSRITEISRPNYALRGGVIATLVIGVIMLMKVSSIIELKRESENLYGMLQGVDSAFNILLLMGAGALFLTSLEARWKRHKVMEHLHEIRSIVHVIDMHQLPKDPSSDRTATVATGPGNAPQRDLTKFEMMRYLDYCSEMLSLAAKVAALYSQSTKDTSVISAVSDIGQLTTNLSNKIWQKISIMQAQSDPIELKPPPPSALL